MTKVTVKKDGIMLEADKIVLGGETTVVTGKIIIDENNHILEIKND